MPLNPQVAREQWSRYIYSRDTGHREFIAKANKCEDFFAGNQWDPAVVRKLAAAKRPTLTINTVLSTLSSIFGEQIDLATEIAFKPRYNAPPENADILTKVFRCISDDNQLTWLREEVFADGCITSRGYYDTRLKFEHNRAGEVTISKLNPRAVLPDPDGNDYDPDTWSDVIVTSWMSPDDIEIMFNKPDADALRARGESVFPQGFDSLDTGNDRFGGNVFAHVNATESMAKTMKCVRVVDRQHRKLSKVKMFIDPRTGDKMQVPVEWDEEKIRMAVSQGQLIIADELIKRVRWTITAEDYVLHDDWSPFKRLTIVPFFPHFRYGRTVGVVEGLIDPQELLNKALSQELHVVNTMANSGWIVKKGALLNMEIDELEERGAETGLIIEVANDVTKDIAKITSNSIPQGLDRLSFKAEAYVKLVSNRGNNQLGMTRPDQSGKLTEASNAAADVTLRKVMRNLERTDFMLARNILELVQNYYTDTRIMHIITDDLTGQTEEININLPDPATGEVLNDLSLGTYTTVITSQKARRTLEESEMAEAVQMRELGIMIPDRFMIENSNLRKKGDIIKAMDAEAQSPEGQVRKQAEVLTHQLTVANLKGEAANLEAQAAQHRAKTALTTAQAITEAKGEPGEQEKAQAEMAIKQQEHEQKMTQNQEQHEQKLQFEREKLQLQLKLQQEEAFEKRRAMRIQAAATAKATMAAPKQPGAPGAKGAKPAAQAAA